MASVSKECLWVVVNELFVDRIDFLLWFIHLFTHCVLLLIGNVCKDVKVVGLDLLHEAMEFRHG